MAEEIKTQSSESSTEMSEALEVSATSEQQSQETQAPTAKQGETQEQVTQKREVPFHEHPRWIERQKEIEDLRTDNAYLKGQIETLIANSGQQKFHTGLEENKDPYAGLTPEEQAFYRNIEKIIDRKVGAKEKEFKEELSERDKQVLRIRAQLFYRDHSDVKPGSLEDKIICQKVAAGYDPDDAYTLVMKDKNIQSAVETAKKQFEDKFKSKKQANVENESIPVGNQVPGKASFDEDFLKELKSQER